MIRNTAPSDADHRPPERFNSTPPHWVAALLVGVGLALWIATAAGLDPGSTRSQFIDFQDYHLPSARKFAEVPLMDAMADYSAAPLPLFYVMMGAVLAVFGSVTAMQIVSVVIGFVVVALVFVHASRNRSFPTSSAIVIASAVMISPYFRGATVYANTDALALMLVVGAFVLAGRPSRPRPIAGLVAACLAVWVRQFYVFAPMAIFLREALGASRSRLSALVIVGALMALPVIALFAWWGGPTPPRFRQHAAWDGWITALPLIMSVFTVYALPSIYATMRFYKSTFSTAMRHPAMLLCVLAWCAAGVLVGIDPPDFRPGDGGGIVAVGLARLRVPDGIRTLTLALMTIGGGIYLSYLVYQNPKLNFVLVLLTISFLPTTIIYQRYFDPLLPIVFGCLLHTREAESLGRSRLALLYPGVELLLSAISHVRHGFLYESLLVGPG